jgi:ankyrin repeat protein
MNLALKAAIPAEDAAGVRDGIALLSDIDECLDLVGNTALLKAAACGSALIVRLLLSMCSNVNKANKNGFSPLMFAASGGHAEALQVLLDAGANIEATSVNRYTALSWAASSGKPDCVGKLLDAGADYESLPTDGQRPVALAAMLQLPVTACLLIRRGANVDARGLLGETPLFAARTSEITTALLEAGADAIAVNHKDLDIASLRETKGTALEPDLSCAIAVQSLWGGKPLWTPSRFGKPLLLPIMCKICKTQGNSDLLLATVRKQAWLRRRHAISGWDAIWEEI